MDEQDPRDLPSPTPSEDSTAGQTENEEFSRLLEASMARSGQEPAAGAQVSGTIVQIGEVDSFVDCGSRSELPIATAELQDDEGKLVYKVGDRITAHVQGRGDQKRLTLALQLREQGMAVLQQAFQDGTPLAGVVGETNKGGFAIDLSGRRAFCPYSQIDLHRVQDPAEYVGRQFPFRILELSPDGRNIVVSRRVLLQQERDLKAEQTRKDLKLGDVREGQVTRLMPFGAFVDLGGIEGLVHISQMAHERVADPSSLLRIGQKVRVKVIEIQNLGQAKQERISLSMKALAEDPWPAAVAALKVGMDVPGRITRLLDYGAFVQVAPGVEGLIHISEMAPHRIRHPREVVNEQDEVTVRILDIDPDRRRLSLSLRETVQPDESEN